MNTSTPAERRPLEDLDSNASAVTTGQEPEDWCTLLIVTGKDHRVRAEAWAVEWNAVQTQAHRDGEISLVELKQALAWVRDSSTYIVMPGEPLPSVTMTARM